jgi:hypothetical protein
MYLNEHEVKKDNYRKEKFKTLSLAMGIGLLPPLWAVISPILGIKVGAVALVCAGIFSANGNKIKDSIKISVGFAISVFWGCLALHLISILPWNKSINQFITLSLMGAAAVIIANGRFGRYIYLPSWLCGWAITLGILGDVPMNLWGFQPISILISMVVGVIYVGIGVIVFGRFVNKLLW